MVTTQRVSVASGSGPTWDVRGFLGRHSAQAADVLCRKLRECARPLSSDRPQGGVTWIGLLVFCVR